MYLPFKAERGHLKMGLKPLSLQSWLEIDEDFATQLTLKAALLSREHSAVFATVPGTQLAQKESLHLVIDHLLMYFPTVYQLMTDDKMHLNNLKTQQTWQLADPNIAPLDLAARLVQEDLCLMQPGAEGYQLAAASVCFPLRWSLREKVGQSIGQIHQRVPEYSQRLKHPVDNMFNRLKDLSPGLRFNWTVVDSPDLRLLQNKQMTEFNPAITAKNAGERLWLRVERQTLRRLPVSRNILFTIRTFVYPLWQVVQQFEAAADLSKAILVLKPDMQVYKNLLPFRQALTDYLHSCIEAAAQTKTVQ